MLSIILLEPSVLSGKWKVISVGFNYGGTQLTFTSSKSTIEMREKGVKYVQS